VKISIFTAILTLVLGTSIVIIGAVLNGRVLPMGHPTILAGLAIDFMGTILLVLGFHQRKRRD
jgi:hypothetical protein